MAAWSDFQKGAIAMREAAALEAERQADQARRQMEHWIIVARLLRGMALPVDESTP